MDLSYQSMKIAHHVREADDLRTEMRRKSLLILVYHHLQGQGFMEAAEALDQETNGGVRKFEVCDNIDLEMVLMEFESYHYVKFQKYPKIIRRTVEPGQCETKCAKSGGLKRGSHSAVRRLPKINQNQSAQSGKGAKKTTTAENGSVAASEMSDFGLNVSSIKNGPAEEVAFDIKERLLKPLNGLSDIGGEMGELATIISRDIYLESPNVRWEDIIGLEDAKRLVKEAVVYPIKYPQLFTGILSPWKSLLLYGPPGTGKTLLAKAVATECHTTLFNISAASIVSKWRGESEKLIRALFLLARHHAPSTIFFDELESVMGQRGGSMRVEHESSSRMKAELLVQMDGLVSSEELVFVMATSNHPWELDHAMLRRLEKRVLVSLPSSPARQAMISHWLPPLNSTKGIELRADLDYDALAKATEGYSGSDVCLVCKEAAMGPVRKILHTLESPKKADMSAIKLDTVTTADVLRVIANTKPSARNLADKYTFWETEYKSV